MVIPVERLAEPVEEVPTAPPIEEPPAPEPPKGASLKDEVFEVPSD
jgi:hypothetical protein